MVDNTTRFFRDLRRITGPQKRILPSFGFGARAMDDTGDGGPNDRGRPLPLLKPNMSDPLDRYFFERIPANRAEGPNEVRKRVTPGASAGGAPNFLPGRSPVDLAMAQQQERANKFPLPGRKPSPPSTGPDLSDANLGLMAGGLHLAANRRPDFLGALGEAGAAGLSAYLSSRNSRIEKALAARDLARKEAVSDSQTVLNQSLAAKALKEAAGNSEVESVEVDDDTGNVYVVRKDGSTTDLVNEETGKPYKGSPETLAEVIKLLVNDPSFTGDVTGLLDALGKIRQGLRDSDADDGIDELIGNYVK